MTRLVLMSDLHTRPASIPKGDVLVLAGDIFCGDDTASLQSDLAWIKSLGMPTVSCIGNHDLSLMHLLRTAPEKATRLLINAGITLLRDAVVEIGGVKFWGVDWQSRVTISTGLDVIISHCPAKGMLDQRYPPKSEHLGDAWLAAQIAKVKPRLVVSGHFHGGYGKTDQNGTTFVNCSLTNEAQQTVNKPWVVELEER